MASEPSLGFVLTRQNAHVQVIAKGDGGVSLVDLRTLAALDFDALNLGALLELLDRAAMPGHACRRPCCDHCNNREGDPDGHDYVPGGSVHDGPCGQCAAERARREHDEGTG